MKGVFEIQSSSMQQSCLRCINEPNKKASRVIWVMVLRFYYTLCVHTKIINSVFFDTVIPLGRYMVIPLINTINGFIGGSSFFVGYLTKCVAKSVRICRAWA